MKIYKENIKRIIQILQEKDLELKEGESFEFKDGKLVKILFTLPLNFVVRAETKENASIMYPYFNSKFGQGWDINTQSHYKTYEQYTYNNRTGEYNVVSCVDIKEGYSIISPKDFIEHVILKNKI